MGPRPIRNLHPYLAADIHDPAGPYMLKSPETKKALLGAQIDYRSDNRSTGGGAFYAKRLEA